MCVYRLLFRTYCLLRVACCWLLNVDCLCSLLCVVVVLFGVHCLLLDALNTARCQLLFVVLGCVLLTVCYCVLIVMCCLLVGDVCWLVRCVVWNLLLFVVRNVLFVALVVCWVLFVLCCFGWWCFAVNG